MSASSTTRSTSARKRRHLLRGYTVVEVAMAMTLFGIGAAAVVAMERSSVQGDLDARKQDVATFVANEWIERLRRDAVGWNQPSPGSPLAADNRTTNTKYLYPADTAACSPGVDGGSSTLTFVLPTVATGLSSLDGASYAFDLFGHDVPVDSTNIMFCAQIYECVEAVDSTGVASLIQATVRVIWPRSIDQNAGLPSTWCAAAGVGLIDAASGPATFRVVSETTLLQRTAS